MHFRIPLFAACSAACLLTSPSASGQGGGAGSAMEWRAINEQTAGASTHPHTTLWGVFANGSGTLKNVATGAALTASLAIVNSGSASATTMGAPAVGSAASTIFSPYTHWNSGAGEAVQIDAADSVTYVFSNLNPARRYTFRGTSLRGNSTFTNRWTRAEITGAVSQTAVHTSGILTSTQQPAFLTATQAAWNSGYNTAGEVVGWDVVDPGADGTFSIITRRYSGDYPGGNTETPSAAPYGYGFQAIRLEQWTDGPPGPPVANPDSATVHPGQKVRISVLTNDTGLVTAGPVSLQQPPGQGTAAPQADGTVFYTAAPGASGSDTFTYQTSGPGGVSGPASVTVTIAATLKIPVVGLNVPAAAPPTVYTLQPAFGSLSFSSPVCLASPPGDSNRLFVCQKGGLLRLIPDVTAATPSAVTFLNLPTLLNSRGESVSTSSEQGLLGLAFHPDFASNRQFFIFYSVEKNGLVYERLSRFTASVADPNAAEAASELILIEQVDDAGNHNGGDLHFGPDGYLYVTLGDEGNQNDSLNNSQTITKDFFAGILRIDVDKKPGSLPPNAHAAVLLDAGVARYAVPPDNPFVGVTSFNGVAVNPTQVRTEFWAVGLRNPWRVSFDSLTGELWVGDVGSGAYEEVDVVTRGGNYGWAYREAAHAGPKSAPGGFTSIDPVHEYPHGSGATQGNSITGGLVYRGSRFQGLRGAYLFADYTSGNVWTLRRNAGSPPTVTRITGEIGIVAFGSDPSNRDVLVADFDQNRLLRLAATTPAGSFPLTLSETHLFHDLSDLTPAPGLVEYAVNLPFWSDHARKRRWFAVPDGVSRMAWSQDANWTLPAGMLWVKHFDLETTRGDPATRKRIETRLVVKTTGGSYGVTYRWNDQQTDAALVPDEGAETDLTIVENGSLRTQRWKFPSRAECNGCHNANAGHALAFNLRQLNRTGTLAGFPGNQLDLLAAHDFLTSSLPSTNLLPQMHDPSDAEVSVEARVRSYLDVNCAYCHRPGGPQGAAAWDARAHLTLEQTGLILGGAINNGGNPENKLVVPGDTAHSVLLNRLAASNGFTRMPPLGSTELDAAGIALVTEWIANRLPQNRTYDAWRLEQFGSAASPEGEPGADPDGDGQTNSAEWAADTQPRQGGSSFLVTPAPAPGGAITLTFSVPENHRWQVTQSTDLLAWSPWDIPKNSGRAAPGGSLTLTGPMPETRRFFRVTVTAD